MADNSLYKSTTAEALWLQQLVGSSPAGQAPSSAKTDLSLTGQLPRSGTSNLHTQQSSRRQWPCSGPREAWLQASQTTAGSGRSSCVNQDQEDGSAQQRSVEKAKVSEMAGLPWE